MKFSVEVNGTQYAVEMVELDGRREFTIDGRPVAADVAEVEPGVYSVLLAGASFTVKVGETAGQLEAHVGGRTHPYAVAVRDPRAWQRARSPRAAEGRQEIVSPMPGKVVRVLVEEGQQVTAQQGLVVVEAMKMQNEIKSPKDGVVAKVAARAGAAVNAGETLVVVE